MRDIAHLPLPPKRPLLAPALGTDFRSGGWLTSALLVPTRSLLALALFPDFRSGGWLASALRALALVDPCLALTDPGLALVDSCLVLTDPGLALAPSYGTDGWLGELAGAVWLASLSQLALALAVGIGAAWLA